MRAAQQVQNADRWFPRGDQDRGRTGRLGQSPGSDGRIVGANCRAEMGGPRLMEHTDGRQRCAGRLKIGSDYIENADRN